MEVRAACFQLYAASLYIVPSRLQFFEYQSISFRCVGFDPSIKWRGVRNTNGFVPTCRNGTGKPTMDCIFNAFETDSGEYWCEGEEGERSSAVNITITAGSVILESPALPVAEGQTVVLVCRSKAALENQRVDFYKDGHHIGTGCFGKLVIPAVSKSDEGLYKCSISRAGESPESWLAVTNDTLREETNEEACLQSGSFFHVLLILRTVFTVLMVALLLLLVGLLHYGKLGGRHKDFTRR
ncbi:uncharacterized protein LOC103374519 [Stegastes partitus]|uniref:Uncharacterized protein LOC103374519 n=1 Tax=Stegastes partitus TaxID=144197 RepID=A0A9Y4NT36_9TELE|nr:PREDICTED: uncharacterized protein LOC103374519 [Stegastes partitus]